PDNEHTNENNEPLSSINETLSPQNDKENLPPSSSTNNLPFPSSCPLDKNKEKRSKYKEEYQKTIKYSLNADSPSTAAKPEFFFRTQETHPIFNGRPPKNTSPPIFLFNSVFGKFLNDYENETLEIPSDIYTWTQDLIDGATKYYELECNRAKAFGERLSERIIPIIVQQYKGKRACDGLAFVKVENFLAYQLFLEVKNELGSGGCDPTVQGAIYYRDHWTQKSSIKICESCCAPSFIIVMSGSWLCILGCVFLENVVIQPLTDFIPLTVNMENFDQIRKIARLFQALHIALCRLENFYRGLDVVSNDQKFFPYINSYQTDDKIVSFIYHYQLKSTLAWKAETTDGRMIVIRFLQEYNTEAHEFCAQKRLAPELLHVSNSEDLRKFQIVITDFAPGIILNKKDKIDPKFYQDIYENVEYIINLLHEKNFVLANLKPTNILTNNINGKQEAMLISFDWCGKHQVKKYPPSMKNYDMPSGVKPGALLDKAHDT
ncbi:10353_t:CDS:2, partial [Dentiscutata heterogama]